MGAHAASGTGNGQVLLAFDYGQRRIGVASANLLTRTASPLVTLGVGRQLPWDEIDGLIEEWRPGRLVVGLPPEDAAAKVATQVRSFVGQLRARYGLDVDTVDESLTSRAAYATLVEQRRTGTGKGRIGEGRLDRHAACLIAEQWLGRTMAGSPDG